ncbi:MAG: hypothetical protein ACE5MI_10470 [Acidimicrobiia bacterium]
MTEARQINWGQLMLGLGVSVLGITVFFWVVFFTALGLDAPDWVAAPLALLLLAATAAVVVLAFRGGNRSLGIGIAVGYALLTILSMGNCTLLVVLIPGQI